MTKSHLIIPDPDDRLPTIVPLSPALDSLEHSEDRSKRKMLMKVLPKLLKVAGRLPFADDLAAAYYAAMDPETPKKAKGVLIAALAYFVLPTDAVPDVIVGLGFADDATVLATAIGVVGSQIKPRHREAARKFLGLPKETPKET